MGWVPPPAPPPDAPAEVHEGYRRALLNAMWPSTRSLYERDKARRDADLRSTLAPTTPTDWPEPKITGV